MIKKTYALLVLSIFTFGCINSVYAASSKCEDIRKRTESGVEKKKKEEQEKAEKTKKEEETYSDSVNKCLANIDSINIPSIGGGFDFSGMVCKIVRDASGKVTEKINKKIDDAEKKIDEVKNKVEHQVDKVESINTIKNNNISPNKGSNFWN